MGLLDAIGVAIVGAGGFGDLGATLARGIGLRKSPVSE